MSITREQLDAAILARLVPYGPVSGGGNGTFKTLSRIIQNWDVPAREQPAVFIFKPGESRTQDKGDPPLRRMNYALVVYVNRGNLPSKIPATPLNTILDAIDAAFEPDPITGFQTLGGLVSHAWIEGETLINEGTLGEQVVAQVPLNILLNSDNNATKNQFFFDSGTLFGVPLRKDGGAAFTDVTPVRFGDLKGITLEVDTETKLWDSQLQYALNAGQGVTRIRGRARFGVFDGRLYNQLIFGLEPTVGAELAQIDELKVITPPLFNAIITPPSGGTFVQDLGVSFTADGQRLVKVAAAPAAGQYSQAFATYQFAAADVGKQVAISYIYSIAAGNSVLVSNAFRYLSPTFQMVLSGMYNGRRVTWQLHSVTSSGLTLPTAVERFAIQEFEFQAFAALSGKVVTVGIE